MITPAAGPLPYEIIGQVRLAFTEIDRQHKVLMDAARAIPVRLVEDLIHGFAKKRAATIQRLATRMPAAPYTITRNTVIYRSLRWCQQPLSDGCQHDGIEVVWLAVGLSRGLAVVTDRPASIFISFHAAGRLLQRAWPAPDIRSTILEAHDGLLAAPEAVLLVMEQHREWALPVASGAFIGDARIIRDFEHDTHIYCRAATFLSNDLLDSAKAAQCAAMQFRDAGPTLGSGLAMPPQLRNHIDRRTKL